MRNICVGSKKACLRTEYKGALLIPASRHVKMLGPIGEKAQGPYVIAGYFGCPKIHRYGFEHDP